MRKNVASQVVAFQMVSTSDGSAVTSGTPTVYVTIDGGTQATGGGTSTHEGNGQWTYAPTQAETNGNHVAFTMALSGAVSQCAQVYPVSYDPTDSTDLGLTNLTGHTPQTGDSFARIGANGASLSAIPWNSSWDTEVESECNDALVALHLDHLLAVDYDPASKPGVSTALMNELIVNESGVAVINKVSQVDDVNNQNDVDSAEVQSACAAAITAAEPIDTNVTQIQGHTLAGTGTQLADGFEFFFNVAIPSKTVNDVGVAGSGLTAADVWTYDISSVSTSGQAGKELNDASAANTTTPPTASAIADAVWDEPRSGHTTSGTYGEHTGDAAMRGTDSANTTTPPTAAAIRSEIDSNSTQLAAIVADTNELQIDLADGGRLDLILDARASQSSVDTIDGIVDSLLVIANKLDGMLELDGAVYRYTTNALEQGPSGGGGGSGDVTSIMGTNLTETAGGQLAAAFSYFLDVATPSKTVNDVGVAGSGLSAADVWQYDITSISTDGQAGKELQDIEGRTSLIGSGTAFAPNRSLGNNRLTVFVGETSSLTLITPTDLSGETLELTFDDSNEAEVGVIEDGSLTKTSSSVTWSFTSAITATAQLLNYSLRRTSDKEVFLRGECNVEYAPLKD